MRSRKIKLLASLTSLVLVVAVMAVGVWAAGNVAVNINGTVNFSAQEKVFATVTVSNATDGTASFTDGDQDTPKAIELTTLQANASGLYTYTVTIKNDRADATANADKANLEIDFNLPAAGANYTLGSDFVEGTILAPGAQTTITVTLQITNLEIATSADVGADITLTNTNTAATINKA